jgi:hypothetical protein
VGLHLGRDLRHRLHFGCRVRLDLIEKRRLKGFGGAQPLVPSIVNLAEQRPPLLRLNLTEDRENLLLRPASDCQGSAR